MERDSNLYRAAYGHTPLSLKEDIPWRCRRLVVGTRADAGVSLIAGAVAGDTLSGKCTERPRETSIAP